MSRRSDEVRARMDAVNAMDPDPDPDMVLITFYVTDELPPEERAAFERRLEVDPEFRERAEPLIWFWSESRRRAGADERADDDEPLDLLERLGTGARGPELALSKPARQWSRPRWTQAASVAAITLASASGLFSLGVEMGRRVAASGPPSITSPLPQGVTRDTVAVQVATVRAPHESVGVATSSAPGARRRATAPAPVTRAAPDIPVPSVVAADASTWSTEPTRTAASAGANACDSTMGGGADRALAQSGAGKDTVAAHHKRFLSGLGTLLRVGARGSGVTREPGFGAMVAGARRGSPIPVDSAAPVKRNVCDTTAALRRRP